MWGVIGPAAPTHTVCGEVKLSVFDRAGSSVGAFYTAKCFHSHNEELYWYQYNCKGTGKGTGMGTGIGTDIVIF